MTEKYQRNWSGTLLHGVLALRQVVYVIITSIQIKDILSGTTTNWTSFAFCSISLLLQLAVMTFLVILILKPEIYYSEDPPYKMMVTFSCFVALDLFRLATTIWHINDYKDAAERAWMAIALHSMEALLDLAVLGAITMGKGSRMGDGLKQVALPFHPSQ